MIHWPALWFLPGYSRCLCSGRTSTPKQSQGSWAFSNKLCSVQPKKVCLFWLEPSTCVCPFGVQSSPGPQLSMSQLSCEKYTGSRDFNCLSSTPVSTCHIGEEALFHVIGWQLGHKWLHGEKHPIKKLCLFFLIHWITMCFKIDWYLTFDMEVCFLLSHSW